MSIATIFKRIVDVLWTAGGIGAAAELGYEDFGSHLVRPVLVPCALQNAGVRGGRRSGHSPAYVAPLEGELCFNPISRRSVR